MRSLLVRPLSEPRCAPRAEPLHHVFVGHPRAFRGPVVSAIELRDFISVGFPRRAVERRQFSNQLWNRQTEFRRSCLEHVRSVLVDLDADVDATTLSLEGAAGPRPEEGRTIHGELQRGPDQQTSQVGP